MKALNYRFCFFILIAVSAILVNTYAQSAGRDSLFYFGHAFVQIKTASGMNIYIDPYNINEFRDSADVVLITHEHSDHNDLSRVKQKSTCRVIRSADAQKSGVYQVITIGDVKITAVAAYNANHTKSQCVGYVVEFDGIKLYHAGDTGKITEMADLAAFHLDYALLCMDGIYTMSPEDATAAAAIINAKHDIPIHTMAPPDTYSNTIVARFTSPNKMIVKPGNAIELQAAVTGVKKNDLGTKYFNLKQNYPNPFNPETTINYSVPASANVSLKIYDVSGREITTLVDKIQSAGNYAVKFSAADLSSGIYFYKLSVTGKSGIFSDTKKMILMK